MEINLSTIASDGGHRGLFLQLGRFWLTSLLVTSAFVG